MQTIDLASIGITQEEIQDRVVKAITERLLTSMRFDHDTDSAYPDDSSFKRKLDAAIKEAIDVKFETLAASSIVPAIAAKVDACVLQRTNAWGEKKGEPVTFVEYLIERADRFLTEPVDKEGRTRHQCKIAHDSFYEVKGANVLTASVDAQITKHLRACVDAVVKDFHAKVGDALGGTLRAALLDAQEKLKVRFSS